MPGGLCNVILAFAETGELEVLVAPQVIAEVDANLTSDHQRRRLGRWREFWVVCSQPASEHVDSEAAQFLALMGHVADVPIAIAIRHSVVRPDFFVTSNHRHRKPSKLNHPIGARIMTPSDFITAMGYPRPRRSSGHASGQSAPEEP